MDVLNQLKEASRKRCSAFGFELDEWSVTDWGNATAGEVGELCNKLKKIRRGDIVPLISVGEEAADVAIYLDLTCQKLGINLEQMIIHTFNQKSDQIGSDIKLHLPKYQTEDVKVTFEVAETPSSPATARHFQKGSEVTIPIDYIAEDGARVHIGQNDFVFFAKDELKFLYLTQKKYEIEKIENVVVFKEVLKKK
jgi:NTP pyrophosphatase (non-canonical NTP hydrolase)